MSVQFQDFSIQVNEAVDEKTVQFLEEAASEIESAARRNSRVASGQLKGSWNHQVDDSGNWHHTKGKTPNRTLQRAFEGTKAAIIRRAKEIFKELGT